MTRRASIAEARGKLSYLVNAVAHGRDRVLLTSRGRPKAAIVGLDDLAALEDLHIPAAFEEGLLGEMNALAKAIIRRRGKVLTDSADDLAALREGTDR